MVWKAWVLKGSQINGLTSGEYSGRSVSINNDGTVIAIGANFNSEAFTHSGTTRIYEWSGTAWVLKGSQINGLTTGERSGWSVSINGDGTVVAIGAYEFDGGVGSNSGTTRIYEWNGTAWSLRGSQINGLTTEEHSGRSVSINSDGTSVAIGAYRNNSSTGTTRIYGWNGTAWTLQKQIDGLTSGEESGFSVSISSNGNIVAIGAPLNDEVSNNAGTTRIYQFESVTTGDTILSGENNDELRFFNIDEESMRIFKTGDVSMAGTLTVSKNSILMQDVSINERLFVNNNVQLYPIDNNNKSNVRDNSILNKDVVIDGTLTVEQDVSFNKNLFVKENTNILSDLSVNNSLRVANDVSINDVISADNAIVHVNKHFVLQEDASLNSRLFVQNDVSFNRNVYAGGKIGINVMNPRLELDISGTDSIGIPYGTTAQRTSGTSAQLKGHIRYNTDTDSFEGYGGTDNSWKSLGGITGLEMGKNGADTDSIHFSKNNVEQVVFKTSGDVSMNKNLYVHKNMIIHGDLSINRLFINNDLSFNSTLLMKNDMSLNNDLTVSERLFVGKKFILDASLCGAQNAVSTDISSVDFPLNAVINQIGATIQGSSTHEEFGFRVSISGNSNIIAVTSNQSNDNGNVKIYQYVSNAWAQLGETLFGDFQTYTGNRFGASIELNYDGTTIVIASREWDNNTSQDTGMVRVYKYKTPTEDEWNNGNKTTSFEGGGIPIIAASTEDSTKTFSQISSNSYWIQVGGSIFWNKSK